MKKIIMKKTLLILFVLPFTLFTQGGKWEIIDYIENGPQWNCIDCYDSLNCVVFGNHNLNQPYNRVTSDGGKTWTTTFRDTAFYTEKVIDVAYPDSNLCIAVGGAGNYWISTDKCQTWENKKMPTWRALDNIDFYDKKFGLIQTYEEIFLTSDGGLTWDYHDINAMQGAHCRDARIIEPEKVISIYMEIENDRILQTNDWGKTWSLSDTTVPQHILYFLPLSSDSIICLGGSKDSTSYYSEEIIKTFDGFKTFDMKLDTVIKKSNGYLIKGSRLRNSNKLIAINRHGHTWKSDDAGETWFYDTAYPKEWASMGDVFWLTESKILAANNFIPQIIMYTEDITDVEDDYREVDKNIILITPNPASDYIEIQMTNHNLKGVVESVKVFDVLGNTVLCLGDSRFRGNDMRGSGNDMRGSGNDMRGSGNDMNDSEGANAVRIDVSGLPQGVYLRL